MDAVIEEMRESFLITKLIKEYCRSCDRLDAARMSEVYAKESWDDHGLRKMPGQTYVKEMMTHRIGSDEIVSHHLGQTLVALTPTGAGAESYFVATLRAVGANEQMVLHHLGGRYIDTLVREEGEWRIKLRLTVRDWSITLPIESDWMAKRSFIEGRADGSDPSFSALGISYRGFERIP